MTLSKKRIVVKVGTSTITNDEGMIDIRSLDHLCRALAGVENLGYDLVLVSSGAIAVGANKMRLSQKPKEIRMKQAAAAVGQTELMHLYDKFFGEYGRMVGQILLDNGDIADPIRSENLKNTFDALLELLQNKEHAYDDSVLKALLYTVSLYPIGTYVYLSNRKIGVVVDSNHTNPKCPIVQMLSEKEADGSPKTIQTDENLSILRVLSKKEKEDIVKLVEQKESAIKQAKDIAEKNITQQNEDAEKKTPNKAIPIAQIKKESSSKAPDGTEEVDISFFN